MIRREVPARPISQRKLTALGYRKVRPGTQRVWRDYFWAMQGDDGARLLLGAIRHRGNLWVHGDVLDAYDWTRNLFDHRIGLRAASKQYREPLTLAALQAAHALGGGVDGKRVEELGRHAVRELLDDTAVDRGHPALAGLP